MNPHLHRPRTASCRPDRAFFWFLAGAFLWLGACRPLSPSGEEPRTPAEETTESRPPEEATDGSKEDASPQDPPQESRPETENRPESPPELATDLPTPEPCTTEGHKRCKATPETCTRLPSGLLVWSTSQACPSTSFCFQGSCLPLPQPIWATRTHHAVLHGGGPEIEVDKRGYVYLSAQWVLQGTFGAFQTPPPKTPSASSVFLAVVNPQGQWSALEKADHDCRDYRLLRHPQGDVYMLCSGAFPKLSRLTTQGTPASFQPLFWKAQGSSHAESASFNTQGELYVLGSTTSSVFEGTLHALFSPDSSSPLYFIAKYSPQLQLVWSRPLPFSLFPVGQSLVMQLDLQDHISLSGSFHREAIFGSFLLQAPQSSAFFARLSPSGSWLSAQTFPSLIHLHMKPNPPNLPLVSGTLLEEHWKEPLFATLRKDEGDDFTGQLNALGAWTWLRQNVRAYRPDFASQVSGHSFFDPKGSFFFSSWRPKTFSGGEIALPPLPSRLSSWEGTLLAVDSKGRWLPWVFPYACYHPKEPSSPCFRGIHSFLLRDGFIYALATFEGELFAGSQYFPPANGENFFLAKWPLP